MHSKPSPHPLLVALPLLTERSFQLLFRRCELAAHCAQLEPEENQPDDGDMMMISMVQAQRRSLTK
jgi:hypothetical protein